jgi:hypothetical protein
MKRQTMLAEIDRQLTQCQIDLAGIHALGAIDDNADALLEKLKTLQLTIEFTENEADINTIRQEIRTLILALGSARIKGVDIIRIKKQALTEFANILGDANVLFQKLKTYHTNENTDDANIQASLARLSDEINDIRTQLKSQGLTDDQIRLLEQIAEESTR